MHRLELRFFFTLENIHAFSVITVSWNFDRIILAFCWKNFLEGETICHYFYTMDIVSIVISFVVFLNFKGGGHRFRRERRAPCSRKLSSIFSLLATLK